jgi:RNA-binding protein
LDATGIHPDHYKQISAFIEEELGIKKKNLTLPLEFPDYSEQEIQQFAQKYELGFETMEDCLKELKRPGLDPREELEKPCFKSDILDIKDVQIGMKLQGIVRNITDFGAFVDVGLHNDGLVHKSQMADYFVTNPIDVVKVGQQVEVRVLDIDLEKEKLSLSMKGE